MTVDATHRTANGLIYSDFFDFTLLRSAYVQRPVMCAKLQISNPGFSTRSLIAQ